MLKQTQSYYLLDAAVFLLNTMNSSQKSSFKDEFLLKWRMSSGTEYSQEGGGRKGREKPNGIILDVFPTAAQFINLLTFIHL